MKHKLSIMLIMFSVTLFAQYGARAYNQSTPTQNNIGNIIQKQAQYWNDEGDRRLAELERMRDFRNKNEPYYQKAMEQANKAWNKNDYQYVVFYYENSLSLGWYDPEFEFIAGISYYKLWESTKKRKYRRLAKEALKLSKKHGNINAKRFLKKEYGIHTFFNNKSNSSVEQDDTYEAKVSYNKPIFQKPDNSSDIIDYTLKSVIIIEKYNDQYYKVKSSNTEGYLSVVWVKK
ncbi:MAG: hypothetical protein KGV59_05020 [Tenacibaculum sp.]|nr:hypothetical protein [Tenacibaculum sp.]